MRQINVVGLYFVRVQFCVNTYVFEAYTNFTDIYLLQSTRGYIIDQLSLITVPIFVS